MAHKFWRVFVNAGSSTGWEAYFRRVDLIDASTNNPLRGGRSWHRLMDSEPQREAELAFDGNDETMYRTAFAPGDVHDWIAYEHPHAVEVCRIIVRQFGNSGNHVTSINLECSHNGSDWQIVHTANNLPVDVYDSGNFATLAQTSAGESSPAPPPVETNVPFEVEGDLGDLEVECVDNYGCYIAGSRRVVAWLGKRVALVICRGVQKEFWPTDARAMRIVVQAIENMLTVYDEMVGRVPDLTSPFRGRVRYEVAYMNAAGLACHGVAGVAIGPAFVKDMYQAAQQGRTRINHALLYETARNYIFPEHFTAVLDYHLSNGPDCWGWVNQGFINVVGCLVCEHIPRDDGPKGVDFNYYGSDRNAFMDSMEAHMLRHIGGDYTWDVSFNRERLPWNQHASVDNLFSGVLVHLYKEHGGFEFLKAFYRCLPEMLAFTPASKSDAPRARDNFVVISSICAKQNLIPWFRESLRWDVSSHAESRLQSAGLL